MRFNGRAYYLNQYSFSSCCWYHHICHTVAYYVTTAAKWRSYFHQRVFVHLPVYLSVRNITQNIRWNLWDSSEIILGTMKW